MAMTNTILGVLPKTRKGVYFYALRKNKGL